MLPAILEDSLRRRIQRKVRSCSCFAFWKDEMFSNGIFLLLLTSSLVNALEENFDPMVAFMCDKPSMHLTSTGWVRDGSTGCLKDPLSILAFCKKVYPKLDIRNVVESTHTVSINNWCNFWEEECSLKFTVVPYRCLAGPFQSEALLVPEGCVFDHIHDSKFCTSLLEWSKSSAKNCQERGLVQNSFSVLQPCEVDRFQGVEFVCCPPATKPQSASSSPVPVVKNASSSSTPKVIRVDKFVATRSKDDRHLTRLSSEVDGPLDDYLKGESFVRSKTWNEHATYMKAKEDMEKTHHDKIAKMMKEWGIARQRVQELKSIDPKASEKLNKEVTGRFQKAYEAEELEAEMEKKQLMELHEQRIQTQLNERKNVALDKFINAIEDEDAELMEIYRALEHYIKILQKERFHAVNKLKRIKAYLPANVNEAKVKAIEHLGFIDKQVKKALDMLKQVPRFEAKINNMIEKSIISLHSMDSIVFNHKNPKVHAILSSTTSTTTTTTTTTTTKTPDYSSYDTFSNDNEDDDDDDEYYDGEMEDESDDIKSGSLSHSTSSSEDNDAKDSDSDDDDELDDKSDLSLEKSDEKKHGKNVFDAEFAAGKKERKPIGSDKSATKKMNKVGGGFDASEENKGSKEEDESRSVDGEDSVEEDAYNDDDEDEDDNSKDNKKSPMTFNTSPEKMKTTSSIVASHEKEDKTNSYGDSLISRIVQKPPDEQQRTTKTNKYGGKGILSKDDGLKPVEPAHFNQDLLHAKQSYIGKSKKEGKEFSSAIPLGLTVGTVTVAIVIVAGVLVMRRRSSMRQHKMIPTEPLPIDLVTSPEENHVANMQVNGYENPTYKYFEMSAQN